MTLNGDGNILPITEKEITELNRRVHLKDFWNGIFIGLCVLAASISIMFNIYLSLKVIEIAKDIRATSDSTKSGTSRLLDCTTPGGKCYEQGRSATSGAVGTINKAIVAAIWCADHLKQPYTYVQLNSCVIALVQ